LPAAHARAGEPLRPGRIYVAPPGCHLLVPGGTAELSNGARINRTRPAVDALFGSAARWFGDRVVAVVLSGVLDDGAVGAALVEQAGGLVVVQEVISSMLGQSGLAGWPHTEPPQVGEVTMEETSDLQFLSPGETSLTRLTCPDCGGALAEGVLPNITYYRCHVGHQFGPKSLAAAQADTAEAKLWGAVAALEETAALGRHLATQAPPADDFAEESNGAAAWATDLASTVRKHIRNAPGAPGADAPSQ
jgi:two-component system, chemotaxis family, protein-glutamate methylesterase/glutaminase